MTTRRYGEEEVREIFSLATTGDPRERSLPADSDGLTLDGILLTMYERENPACERVAQYVRSHLPANMVFDVVIPRTIASTEAFAAGQPVVLREPADAASQAYVNLATVLAERFE